MVSKTRKTRKVSKRVTEMQNDPESVWGKNKELEKFWGDLASGKNVVVIYKDKTHKVVKLPNTATKKYQSTMDGLKEDANVIAILSSNASQDAYEEYLYPKAKDKTVDYVIEHYGKYFKPMMSGEKLRVPL